MLGDITVIFSSAQMSCHILTLRTFPYRKRFTREDRWEIFELMEKMLNKLSGCSKLRLFIGLTQLWQLFLGVCQSMTDYATPKCAPLQNTEINNNRLRSYGDMGKKFTFYKEKNKYIYIKLKNDNSFLYSSKCRVKT